MQITADKRVYFLSDFHLGAPDAVTSREREKKIISFLDEIKSSAAVIFLVGDMFDFWYEYKNVVPKGYVRLLGKLAEITDSGIKVYFFAGNHDMWMNDYFEQELQVPVYFHPKTFTFNHKKFLIGHGDGLGPGDHGYKLLKKVFRNPAASWAFGILPPRLGMGLANYFSRKSREATGKHEEIFQGEENEWLISYCRNRLESEHFDYCIFGHRHLPIDFLLNTNSRYINLGDWIRYFTFASFDGQQLSLQSRYPELEHLIVRQ
ncbi:MAG TPA: UDP-2,3-diacylglucosamine diphosphatase [Flavitalea sp.]|nr:UDP-2,3-diacylglucosamine diphosphatase [Flavitalea sp.]